MRFIIAGGTGFIGQALTERWLAVGHQLIIVGRSKEKVKKLFGENVIAMEWPELTISSLENVHAIINLAGAGIGDKRWTSQRKQEILQSRIQPTQQLAQLCGQLGAKSPPLFNADGVGIYGAQQSLKTSLPLPFTEDSSINYQQAPDFLAKVGREWEMALQPAVNAGVRVVKMRFGVVLAKHGGALPKIALPFYFYLGGPIGSGQQPFSWIALSDLCAVIEFLLPKTDVSGPVNLVAPEAVTQKQFAQTLASIVNRPAWLPMPAIAVKLLFGEMGKELLLSGQNVYPKRLLELGFKFQYPDLLSALKNIYS